MEQYNCLEGKDAEKFLKKMKETEESEITEEDKKLLENVKKASEILFIEDKKLMEELAKK